MRTHLQYGTTGLEVDLPSDNLTVLAPRFLPGLADERAGFQGAMRAPIASRPLRELISAGDKVAIVIPDITRPLPTARLLPWLFEELAHVPAANFTILNGTGSHRANTPEELAGMVGPEVLKKYKVVNHNSHDLETLKFAGMTPDGFRVNYNREYVEADKRIVMGFIEPHFMDGIFRRLQKKAFSRPSLTSHRSCIITARWSSATRAARGACSKIIRRRIRFAPTVRCCRWIS